MQQKPFFSETIVNRNKLRLLSAVSLCAAAGLAACDDGEVGDGGFGGDTATDGSGGDGTTGTGGADAGTGGTDTGTGGTPTGTGGADSSTSFQEQVNQGETLYMDNCAQCHGDDGQGENGPALWGEGALPKDPPEDREFRMSQFMTAADVFAFAQENMPFGDADSVTDQQKVMILAYVLDQNGVELDMPLTLQNADDVVINE